MGALECGRTRLIQLDYYDVWDEQRDDRRSHGNTRAVAALAKIHQVSGDDHDRKRDSGLVTRDGRQRGGQCRRGPSAAFAGTVPDPRFSAEQRAGGCNEHRLCGKPADGFNDDWMNTECRRH
jgi:hypothetical protein